MSLCEEPPCRPESAAAGEELVWKLRRSDSDASTESGSSTAGTPPEEHASDDETSDSGASTECGGSRDGTPPQGQAADEEASDSDASAECGGSRDGTPPQGQAADEASDSDASAECGCAPRLRFRDDALVEVVEVESWKEYTRFTPDDRARAESEWRSRLLAQLQDAQGEADQQHAVEQLEGAVVELATAVEESGSLVVRRALELAPLLLRARLMAELYGWVPGLLRSPHGGEVLRTCVRLCPEACGFIARQIDGHAVDCLWLRGGAEVLCELLRCLPTAQMAPIKTELLERLNLLCYNPQGGLVIRTLLECGACEDQQQTAEFFSEKMEHMDELTRGIIECHTRAATASIHP